MSSKYRNNDRGIWQKRCFHLIYSRFDWNGKMFFLFLFFVRRFNLSNSYGLSDVQKMQLHKRWIDSKLCPGIILFSFNIVFHSIQFSVSLIRSFTISRFSCIIRKLVGAFTNDCSRAMSVLCGYWPTSKSNYSVRYTKQQWFGSASSLSGRAIFSIFFFLFYLRPSAGY